MGNGNEFGELLKQLREEKGFGINQLATYSGVSSSQISRIEQGKRGVPKVETIRKLATALGGSSYEELMKKADHKFVQAIGRVQRGKVVFEEFKSEFIDLPVLGTIRAGEPIDRVENYEGSYPARKDKIRGYDAFWLKVKGESMSGDEIHDGDIVCVIYTPDISPSDIAVVAINGNEATLKRVKHQDEMCILIPSNKDVETQVYPAKDVHIIGKVVGFQRYL
jgi:repressor LexA